MKLFLFVLFAAAVVSAQESSFTNGRPFRVWFDNIPQESSSVVYWVYTSTNITLPVGQWQAHETGWETNGAVVVSTNFFPAVLPLQLFVVASSNEFGLSFSEPFASAPPRSGKQVGLKP